MKKASLWWRDVVNYNVDEDFSYWFLRGLGFRLGFGEVMKFWHNNWLEGIPFRELYSAAFRKSVDNMVSVEDMGAMEGNKWVRRVGLHMLTNLKEEEAGQVYELINVLNDVTGGFLHMVQTCSRHLYGCLRVQFLQGR